MDRQQQETHHQSASEGLTQTWCILCHFWDCSEYFFPFRKSSSCHNRLKMQNSLYLLIGENTTSTTERGVSTQYCLLSRLQTFCFFKSQFTYMLYLKTIVLYVENRTIVPHFRDFLLKMNCTAKCYNLNKIKELLFLFDLLTLFPRNKCTA